MQIVQESATINCAYLRNDTSTSCNATIYYGDSCQNHMELYGMQQSDELVSIDIERFLEETMGSRYCSFTVIATSGTKLLYVEGDLSKSGRKL